MPTPRDPLASRHVRANGDNTVYQREDGRWEAAGYVLARGNTHRVRVYGTTRKEALAKLTEKIAASNVRTGTPRARRFEPLTADEARRLLTASQGHRLHALFELALHTGLRKGELLGLPWEDLNLDQGTGAIRRTLQRTSTGGLTALPTKNAGLRAPHRPPLPLPPVGKAPPRKATVRP